MSYATLSIYFICALVAVVPLSAADLDAALARCGPIEEDAKRLACYDRLAQRTASDARAAAPALETEPIAMSSDEAGAKPPQAEETERSVWRRWFKRDRKSAAEEAVAEDAGRASGRGNRATVDEQQTGVAGEIVRIRELMHGNFQVTLDNGQVWRENEYEPNTTYAVGDRVTVEPSLMGTQVLRNKRTRQSARVRRVR